MNWTAIVWIATMLGFIWFTQVLLTVNVPAELPVSRFWQLFIANNEILLLITRQDLGVTVDAKGEKLISKYPVDSSSFYRANLKIKFEGEDSVLGDTTIGCEGITQLQNENISAKRKKVISSLLSFDIHFFEELLILEWINELLSIILLSLIYKRLNKI